VQSASSEHVRSAPIASQSVWRSHAGTHSCVVALAVASHLAPADDALVHCAPLSSQDESLEQVSVHKPHTHDSSPQALSLEQRSIQWDWPSIACSCVLEHALASDDKTNKR
jgi:hypothetical protein